MRPLILLVLVGIVGCDSSKSNEPKTSKDSEVKQCILKGQAYFKEIGSWPYLSSGQPANDAVLSRCERQPKTAF